VYADNSTAEQSVDLTVVPSSAGLKQFTIDQGFHQVELKLNEDAGESTEAGMGDYEVVMTCFTDTREITNASTGQVISGVFTSTTCY